MCSCTSPNFTWEVEFCEVANEIPRLGNRQRKQPQILGRAEGAGRPIALTQLAPQESAAFDNESRREGSVLFVRFEFDNGHRGNGTKVIGVNGLKQPLRKPWKFRVQL